MKQHRTESTRVDDTVTPIVEGSSSMAAGPRGAPALPRPLREQLAEASPAVIWATDPSGSCVFRSRRWTELTGQSETDAMGLGWLRAVCEDDAPLVVGALTDAHEQRCPFRLEYRVRRGDGPCRWVLDLGQPRFSNNGEFLGFAGTTVDITDHHRAEAEMRGREHRLGQIMNLVPVAVYACDTHGRITYFNRRAAELWGRTPRLMDHDDRFCGSLALRLPDGRPLPHEQTPMARAIREGVEFSEVEVIVDRPDGTSRTVSVNIDLLRDERGAIIGAVNTFTDITEFKRAAESDARLAAIVESSEDAIISKTLEGVIMSWNRGAERIFGFTDEEAIGRSIKMLIPPDRMHEEDDILARLRRGERINHYETVRRAKDGRSIHVSLTTSPVRDRQGRIIGASKVARDITDQKRARLRLAAEHAVTQILAEADNLQEAAPRILERLSETLGAAAADLWVPDARGTMICTEFFASHEFESLGAFDELTHRLRFMPGESLPGRVWKSGRPEWVNDLKSDTNFRRAPASGSLSSAFAFPILVGDQCEGVISLYFDEPVECDPALLDMAGALGHELGQFVLRGRAEESARRYEQRFRVAQELSLDAFSILESVRDETGAIVDFRWIYANPSAARILRRRRSDLIGRRLCEVLSEGRSAVDLFERLVRVVENGNPCDLEIEYHGDGIDGWFRNMVVRIEDGVAVYFSDITDRKRAEQRIEALTADLTHRVEEWRALFELLPAGVLVCHDPMCFEYSVNRAGASMLGLTPGRHRSGPNGEHAVLPFKARRHGVELPADQLPMRRALESGSRIIGDELEIVRDDGTSLSAWFVAAPLYDSNGRIRGSLAVFIDVTEHQKAERALRENEQRLRLALGAGGMGAFDADLKAQTVRLDAAANALLGVEGDAPFAFEELLARVHPDDRNALLERWSRAAAGESDYEHEFRIVRPDGETRWLAGKGHLLLDRQGNPARIIGVNWDVTEAKAVQERTRTLMGELSHRVKNTLATVQSIASRTLADRPEPREFAEAFEGRLQALSVAHNLLTQSRWEGADLRTVLNQTILPYHRDAAGAGAVLSGPAISLTPSAAVIASMVFHELATNAAKYGALSTPEGVLTVRWEKLVIDDEPSLRIEWIETGGPAVSLPTREGFGNQLISRSIEYQLEGEVEQTFDPGGLRCVIRVPLNRVTRQL